MKYVERGDANQITGIFEVRQYEGQEELEDNHADIAAYHARVNKPAPNVGAFRVGMMADAAYQRVINNAPRHVAFGVLGAILLDSPNWPILAACWNQAIAALAPADKPTAEEVDEWNTLAIANDIPLVFADTGAVSVDETP